MRRGHGRQIVGVTGDVRRLVDRHAPWRESGTLNALASKPNPPETIMDTAFYAERSRPVADRMQDGRLAAIEQENARLKLLLAEALLENSLLKQQGPGADETLRMHASPSGES